MRSEYQVAVTYNHPWQLGMDLICVCFVWHVETATQEDKRTMAYKENIPEILYFRYERQDNLWWTLETLETLFSWVGKNATFYLTDKRHQELMHLGNSNPCKFTLEQTEKAN